tara:strand:+ start:3966 stop:4376 length:411 start_codon:yes stop_codon:yes gene_type:complete
MINISGFSKQQPKLLRGSKKLAAHLGIDVDLTIRKIKETRKDKYGFAYHVDDLRGIIIFKDCPIDKLSIVIAHEFVHVHQELRGDMKFDYKTQTFYWKGEIYNLERLATLDYYDRPWEAEAKKLEKKLAESFFMST